MDKSKVYFEEYSAQTTRRVSTVAENINDPIDYPESNLDTFDMEDHSK